MRDPPWPSVRRGGTTVDRRFSMEPSYVSESYAQPRMLHCKEDKRKGANICISSRGRSHTSRAVELAVQAPETGHPHSSLHPHRENARLFLGCGIHVVCVTHARFCGTRCERDVRRTRARYGHRHACALTTHVLSGAGAGISSNLGGAYPAEVMAIPCDVRTRHKSRGRGIREGAEPG
jgi:plasmid stabilization system protein ParE